MQDREQQWATDMRAAQAGSGEAYIRLLESVSTSFRQFAALDLRRFGLQPSDVEDVLQEILLAIHLKRHTWRTDHPCSSRAKPAKKVNGAGGGYPRPGTTTAVPTGSPSGSKLVAITPGTSLMPCRARSQGRAKKFGVIQ